MFVSCMALNLLIISEPRFQELPFTCDGSHIDLQGCHSNETVHCMQACTAVEHTSERDSFV